MVVFAMRRILSFLSRKKRVPDAMTAAALAPLSQAQRCLDLWLREEDRRMSHRQRQRTAALIARYFEHEDEVTDQLILSFLRHYSGFGAVDLDDPHMVRQELKAALDRAPAQVSPAAASHRRLLLAAITGMLAMAAVLVTLHLSQATLNDDEQAALKAAVAARAKAVNAAPATIWAGLKHQFNVTRYQQIRRWDFEDAKELVEKLP